MISDITSLLLFPLQEAIQNFHILQILTLQITAPSISQGNSPRSPWSSLYSLSLVETSHPIPSHRILIAPFHLISFHLFETNVTAILAAVQESTARYTSGIFSELFDGIPTAIKNSSEVAGYRIYNGRAANNAYPTREATKWPFQRLEGFGVIFLGKTYMYEYGTDTTGLIARWGISRNPFDRHYYPGGSSPGGSSSGLKCAVAAGLVPFIFGDGGGSICIPASVCNIYGLKPSFGRLEDTGRSIAVSDPMAFTMMDLEAMYRVLAHPNPSDSTGQYFAHPNTTSTAYPQTKTIWFSSYGSSEPTIQFSISVKKPSITTMKSSATR